MEIVTPKWCTYGAWGKKMPSFIGRLERMEGKSGVIRYVEGQMYPWEYWDMAYVEVHESLNDAIVYMMKHGDESFLNNILQCLHFPSFNNEIDMEFLKKAEDEIYEKRAHGIRF